MEKWFQFARGLALSLDEKKRLALWQKLPDARSYLGLFSVLKAHGFAKDACEILTWTALAFPNERHLHLYLACEYYHLGLIVDAWQSLQEAREDLDQNSLALNLSFKCAILLNRKDMALSLWAAIAQQRTPDAESSDLSAVIRKRGFRQAREKLRQCFVDRRIPLVVYSPHQGKQGDGKPFYNRIASQPLQDIRKAMSENQEREQSLEDAKDWYRWEQLEKIDRTIDYLLSLKGRLNTGTLH